MFAGAFLYAITRGEDFPTAGRFASLAAGRIVANYGPRLPAADYQALRDEFFRQTRASAPLAELQKKFGFCVALRGSPPHSSGAW